MTINTGVNVSKVVAYAALKQQTGVNVSKLNAYAVLVSPNLTVSKLNAYAVLYTPISPTPSELPRSLTLPLELIVPHTVTWV